jgi:hypothetical protein
MTRAILTAALLAFAVGVRGTGNACCCEPEPESGCHRFYLYGSAPAGNAILGILNARPSTEDHFGQYNDPIYFNRFDRGQKLITVADDGLKIYWFIDSHGIIRRKR